MPKEWILNNTTNRYQLNYKKNVGATSENIRKCAAKTLEQWRDYYFKNVKPKKHLAELGKRLYVKITEDIQTEIQTVYGELQQALNIEIEFAPDKWDRLYNVDFFIQIQNKYIGLQIKPINQGNIQLLQVFKEKSIQKKTHKKFQKKYSGIFFIYFLQNKPIKKSF